VCTRATAAPVAQQLMPQLGVLINSALLTGTCRHTACTAKATVLQRDQTRRGTYTQLTGTKPTGVACGGGPGNVPQAPPLLAVPPLPQPHAVLMLVKAQLAAEPVYMGCNEGH
jgi:hypothetical protein